MTQSQPPSLQDAIRRRRQQTFVGRDAELEAFREQLGLAWDDPRRRYVLNVYGQGGVGKTTLLREFSRIARGQGAAAALSDDTETDVPAVMARLAGQLGEDAPGDPFYAFNKAYHTYRQKRAELEADPDAPTGLAGLFGRAAVRLGAKALRNTTPGADLVLSVVEDPLAEQAGQWAEFVRRKLGNRDEVQLVLEPEAVLSPLFVQGVGALAAGRPVALLCDTYERTAPFLDAWLRALLDGRHGELPANLTLVIAGRNPLDGNAWADLEGVTAALCLEAFSEAKAREYLARRGVTHEAVVAVILSLSGRLPLLLMLLAGQSPDDPARRALALNGALPRRLNADVVALLSGVALLGGGEGAFDWLVANRLIEQRAAGAAWTYHEVVREQMLRHKRQASPGEWTALHERLAGHYAAERDGLGLSWSEGARNEAWRAAALEALYHRLCARPDRELAVAINEFVSALDNQRSFAAEWAATLAAAGHDAGHKALEGWGTEYREGLQAYEDDRYDAAAEAFTRLLEWNKLEILNRPIVLAWRGENYRLMERYDEALADFDRAIELDPKYAWAIGSRGETYRLMERYDEALANFDRAIEIDPNLAWAVAHRGETYRPMERYDEALADFDRAIELDPKYAWAIGSRGVTYRLMERYDEALADFDRAIELDPKYAWAIGSRGQVYQAMGRYDEALADFDRAVELELTDWRLYQLAITRRALDPASDWHNDLDRAITLEPIRKMLN